MKQKTIILLSVHSLIVGAALLGLLPSPAYSQTNDPTLQPIPSMVVYGKKGSSHPCSRVWDGTRWLDEACVSLGGVEEPVAQSDFRGLWRFDESLTSGTTAIDDSGQGNNGIISGASRVVSDNPNGSFGNALSFDGVNDYVQVNNSASLENVTESSFTFEAWAKPQDVPPTDCTTNNNTCRYAVVARPGTHTGIFYTNTQTFEVTIWNSAGDGFGLASTALAPGVWHHLVLVVDDVAKLMYFYVDGQPVSGSPRAYTGALRDYGTSPYYIGAANPPSPSFKWHFKGSIDEAAIYSRALIQSEVLAHFQNGILLGQPIAEPSQVVLRASPKKDEKVLGIQDTDRKLTLLIWDGATAIWSNKVQASTPSGIVSHPSRSFDIAYEQQSGEALVVYGDSGSMFPRYRVWDGTQWTPPPTQAPLTVPVTQTSGVPVWIRLEPKPNSNEILLVYQDTNNTINALVWDGTTFGHEQLLETQSSPTISQPFDIAYEQKSCSELQLTCEGLAAWARSGNPYPQIRTWNGTVWTAQRQAGISGIDSSTRLNFVRLEADPTSDRIALGTSDSNSDLFIQIWDGSTWMLSGPGSPFQVANDLSFTSYQRTFDLAWERFTGRLIAVYGLKNRSENFFRIWTLSGGWPDQSSFGSEVVAQSDFRGLWHFDEGSGTTALDSSGNGNHGAIIGGAGYVTGKFVTALNFDGLGQYVNVPDSTSLRSASFTVEGWLNPDTLRIEGIISKVSGNRWRVFMADTLGTIEFDMLPGEIGNLQSTTRAVVGQWMYFAATYDSTTQTARLYINGNLERTVTGISDMGGDTASSIEIASETPRFAGRVDEVAIYSRALIQDEVQAHFQNGILLGKPIVPAAVIQMRSNPNANDIFAGVLGTLGGIKLHRWNGFTWVDSTNIEANGSGIVPSLFDQETGSLITVYPENFMLSYPQHFIGKQLTVISANPSVLSQGAGQITSVDVMITGAGIDNGATVSFSGSGITVVNNPPPVSSDGGTITPAVRVDLFASPGLRDVTIRNPGGETATGFGIITIRREPTITGTRCGSQVPCTLGPGATNQTMTITGQNFDASGVTVTIPDVNVTVTGITTTEITTLVSVPSGATPGSRDVTVHNNNGQVNTGPGIMTINPAPNILSIVPSSRPQGSINQTLTITGSNFQDGATLDLSQVQSDLIAVGGLTPSDPTKIEVANGVIQLKTTGSELTPNSNTVALWHFNSPDGKELSLGDLDGVSDVNLKGLWHLNENGGTAAGDSSGNNNIGIYNGGVLQTTAGKFGRALSFDGVDDYVQINNSASLENVTESSFTFEAWAKPQDVPPTDCTTNNNTCSYAVVARPGAHTGIFYTNTQTFEVTIWNSAGDGFGLASTALAPGSWHHLVLVVDDVAKQMYFYVDGQPVSGSPLTYTGTLRDYGTSPYYIGAANPPSPSFKWHFKGSIDEVGIYNTALSATTVGAHYSRSILNDVTANNNDGDMIGPVSTIGRFFEALSFDGIDDYVQVNNSTSLENVTESSFTFEAWAKPQDVPPTDCTTNNNTCSYAVIARPGFHTGIFYTNTQTFEVTIWNSAGAGFGLASTALAPGSWHHLVLVVDDVAKLMYFYVDGQPVSGSPKAYTGALRDYGTSPYYIGAANPPSPSFKWHFKGSIDEMAIYNTALNSSTIQDHFNRGLYSQTFQYMQTPAFSGGANFQSWNRLVVGLTGLDADGTVQVSYSTDGGSTFSAPEIVTSSDPEVLLTGALPNPIIFRIELKSATGINKRDVTALDLHYTISGSGITVNNPCIFDSATQLRCVVNLDTNAPVGSTDVTVTNPDGGIGQVSQGFAITPAVGPPSINSVTPSTVTQGEVGRLLTITGNNFVTTPQVNFGGTGITTTTVSLINANTLNVLINVDLNAGLGNHSVSVTNPDGLSATLSTALNVLAIGSLTVPSGTSTTLSCSSERWAYDSLTIAPGGSLTLNCDMPLKVYNTLSVQAISATNFGQIVVDPVDTFVTISAGNVIIQPGAKIQADGKGCITDQGYDISSSRCSGTAVGHGVNGGGGGYGGSGGEPGRGTGQGGLSYAESTARSPLEQGSGGGSTSQGAGGAGGGAIRLEVLGTLTLDGVISSSGQSGTTATNFGAGGGSGGSIYVTADRLTGSGSFVVTGGSGGRCSAGSVSNSFSGGGGGGGRIGVQVLTFSTFLGNFSASGGQGGSLGSSRCGAGTPGQAGTLFFSDPTTETALILSGDVRLPFDQSFRSLTVPPTAVLYLSDQVNLTLRDSSSFDGAIRARGFVTIKALGNFTVPASATLSANEGGCTADNGYDVTTARCRSDASGKGTNGSGGGYGGEGGTSGSRVRGGLPYGSATSPAELGSGGGGSSQATGGAGGGAIRLDVMGALILDGMISSNGQSGETARDFGAGGGSGGSIYVKADRLSGNGSFVADGGAGGACTVGSTGTTFSGGGGGGGRIVVYAPDVVSFTGSLNVLGGPGGTLCRGIRAGTPGALGTALINPVDIVPPDPIADLTISAVSSNSIDLRWTATGDDGQTGTATSYDIRYANTPITDNSQFNLAIQVVGEPTPQVAGTVQTLRISGLFPGTPYCLAIRVTDDAGNTSALNTNGPVCGTTNSLDTTPPAAVTDLATGTITNNSVVLTWTPVGDDGMTGLVSRYDLRYTNAGPITEANFASASPVSVPGTLPGGTLTKESFVVTGLVSGQTYYFAIKACDEASNCSGINTNGPVSATIPADTIPPGRIIDLRVDTASITTSSLKLLWTAIGDDGSVGQATSYIVKYSTTSITNLSEFDAAITYSQNLVPRPAGSQEAITVSGLNPQTSYYFAIVAVDEAGNRGPLCDISGCAVTTGTTATPPPDTTSPQPINDLRVALSSINNNSVVLEWTAQRDDFLPGPDGLLGTADDIPERATAFELRYATFPINDSNFSSATLVLGLPLPGPPGSLHTFKVSGLTSNTLYYFAIKAVDEAGNRSGISSCPTPLPTGTACPPVRTALRIGYNMVSVPLIPNPSDPTSAFGDDVCVDPTTNLVTIYQWQSNGLVNYQDPNNPNLNGRFVPVTVLREGEGYFLWSCGNFSVIDALGQNVTQGQTHIPLSPGWTIIGNPYQSNVLLSNSLVRRYIQGGIDETFPFATAVQSGWVGDSLYIFDGATNDFTPFNGTPAAAMEPWKGYWLEVRDSGYITNSNYRYELIVPRP